MKSFNIILAALASVSMAAWRNWLRQNCYGFDQARYG